MTSSFSGVALFGLLDPAMFAVKLLAVVGGATVGAIGTGWLARGLAKMMAFQKVSPFLLRSSRLLGGLAAGYVVWASVMVGGGSGLWPFGTGGGGGTSSADGNANQPAANSTATPEDTRRIHMLGGKAAEESQRFYRLGADEPRTWQDLEPILDQIKTSNLKVIEIVIGKDSVDEENPAVKKLKAWATRNGVKVQIENPR